MSKLTVAYKIPLTLFSLLIVALLLLSYKEIQHRSFSEPNMIYVKGGEFTSEEPVTHHVKKFAVKSFLLDKNVVTVKDFDAFVKATKYITEAEKFGNAGVFNSTTGEWELVDGANYRYPFGKDKEAAKKDHPVTQVSWNDAQAYAKWIGKRLPTQWEWEFAARNGKNTDAVYAWGKNLVESGKYKANTWQGSFPFKNTVDDGYETTSPVGAFGETSLGLTDMGGNVWQWCSDSIEPTKAEAIQDPATRRVLRGGSFLCDPLVCHGYKVDGRSSSTPETALVHLGFRCAKDI
jgi:formylglycine-generating enzyme